MTPLVLYTQNCFFLKSNKLRFAGTQSIALLHSILHVCTLYGLWLSSFTLHAIPKNLRYPDLHSRLSSLRRVFRLPPSSLGPTCNTRGDDTEATDELRRHVHPQRNHIGPVYTAHSVFVCVAGLSPVCVCARSNWKKMPAILVAPIRGCAHVKVYLKWLNEAWPNGS